MVEELVGKERVRNKVKQIPLPWAVLGLLVMGFLGVAVVVPAQFTSNSTLNFWNLSGETHLFPNDLDWNVCLGRGCTAPSTPLEVTGNVTIRGGNFTIQGQNTVINMNDVNTRFDNGTCLLDIGRTGSVEIC